MNLGNDALEFSDALDQLMTVIRNRTHYIVPAHMFTGNAQLVEDQDIIMMSVEAYAQVGARSAFPMLFARATDTLSPGFM